MLCPFCKTQLKKSILCNIEIDYCPKCLGLWFEEEELRIAKDEKDKGLSWLDIDLWEDKARFEVSSTGKLCPSCGVPLYEVGYGGSNIKVDLCNLCHGIWLDKGEFKKLTDYLKDRAGYEVLENYSRSLLEEFKEIFVGPETLKEEILDFLVILKLLNYKFAVRYPIISQLISELPK